MASLLDCALFGNTCSSECLALPLDSFGETGEVATLVTVVVLLAFDCFSAASLLLRFHPLSRHTIRPEQADRKASAGRLSRPHGLTQL